MRNDSLVGLRYSGKKIPFTFYNESFLQKKTTWNKKGDVVDIPLEDAERLVKGSPSDFQMVYKSPMDAMKLPEPDPIFSDEGMDEEPEIEVSKSEEEKVDELFEKVAPKKGPGRPKKEDKDAS